MIEASEYDVRFYDEPIRGILPVADDRQIWDIVGRHVLGNWLSDRMVRSTAAGRNITCPKSCPDITGPDSSGGTNIIATRCQRARNTAQITCAIERDNRALNK